MGKEHTGPPRSPTNKLPSLPAGWPRRPAPSQARLRQGHRQAAGGRSSWRLRRRRSWQRRAAGLPRQGRHRPPGESAAAPSPWRALPQGPLQYRLGSRRAHVPGRQYRRHLLRQGRRRHRLLWRRVQQLPAPPVLHDGRSWADGLHFPPRGAPPSPAGALCRPELRHRLPGDPSQGRAHPRPPRAPPPRWAPCPRPGQAQGRRRLQPPCRGEEPHPPRRARAALDTGRLGGGRRLTRQT